MSVLSRSALEESPLADLHLLATELGMDGFRRLRKADLIDAIIVAQGGDPEAGKAAAPEADDVEEADEAGAVAEEGVTDEDADSRPARSRRGRRGGRGRSRDADRDRDDSDSDVEYESDRPRGGGGRGRGGRSAEPAGEERVAEGVVELLGNGSGFLRVNPPDASDDDVYISAAQIRRCELVSGDRVAGPVRPPRRSERYPSLVRIDTINDRPADEVAEGTHFDDLPSTFPTERFSLGADDPTLKAVEWLTPLGRGSRATIVGPARAGKSEALRRLAAALVGQEGLEVTVVLAGVRPEEIAGWNDIGVEPASALSFAASADSRAQAIERAVETARRVAARGGHSVVLIDTLDGLQGPAARRLLAAARNLVDGGSLTIVGTAAEPLGGETTVIALDLALTSTGRFPALDLAASGAVRPDLLVGQAGADAIAQARAAAIG